MEVSVIIPVYNAAGFVRQAVESALQQPETAEVILVEDGSPDNSLEVCRQLAAEHDRVHLHQHPRGANRGAGASRNLGMQRSASRFIAFLDADDFYLPKRFTAAERVFASHTDCDGVYEAIGIHFEDEMARQRWLQTDQALGMMAFASNVSPEDVFRMKVKGGSGDVSPDGLVIRRAVLQRLGYMNEALRLHQDTEFILRLAAVGRLMAGRLDEPVAVRRVHGGNRISASRSAAEVYRDFMKMWVAVYRWCGERGLKEHQHLVLKRLLGACRRTQIL